MQQIKQLPRDKEGNLIRTFKANGNTYVIHDISQDSLTIKRFMTWQKFTTSLGFGVSFKEHFDNLTKAERMVDRLITEKQGLTELLMHLRAMKESITDDKPDRAKIAFYVCTLFINKEGEDLSDWTTTEADKKIEDWNAEGYDYNDFLSFALMHCPGYRDLYLKTIQLRENLSERSGVGA